MKKLLKIPLAIGGAASALTLAIDKAYRYNLHKRKCLFVDLAEVDKDKFHWEFIDKYKYKKRIVIIGGGIMAVS